MEFPKALYGYPRIFENANLIKTIQVRFPRSKKKRLIKKWKKNESNFKTVPDPSVYVTPMGWFCHPETAVTIRKNLESIM